MSKPLFNLGQVVATPGALAALEEAGQSPIEFLQRHQTGDWSEMVKEDQEENQRAIEQGFRVFSSYKLSTGQKLWVITEWNRSVTTLLLPLEY
jgi:hypothetical protein